MIRPCTVDDAGAVCGIYNHYVEKTVVSFETEPVGEAAMAGRIAAVTRAYPWCVLEEGGDILGFAYASAFRERAAYYRTAETTIYLRQGLGRRGLGRALYGALFKALEPTQIHRVIASISLPNAASVGLHEAMGYRKVGEFPDIGHKFGGWVSVGYWSRTVRD